MKMGVLLIICVLVIFCSMLFLLQFSCFMFHVLSPTLLRSIYHYPTNEHLTVSISALHSHNVLACSSLAPIVSMDWEWESRRNCSTGCA